MYSESGSAIVARRARVNVARNRAANHHAGHRKDCPQAVSVVMGRTTPLVCVVAGLGGTDGAICRQYRLSRAGGVSAALEVGSAGRGIANVGVRDPCRIWRPNRTLGCQEP